MKNIIIFIIIVLLSTLFLICQAEGFGLFSIGSGASGATSVGGDAGAITFHDEGSASYYGANDYVVASAVEVSAGDIIIVLAGTTANDTACSTISDDSTNSYTMSMETTQNQMCCGYAIAGTANATLDVTATFATYSTDTRYSVVVGVFSPASGETGSLDVLASKGSAWEDTPWETETFSTTGTDTVIMAGFHADSATSRSNQEIPSGSVATTLTMPDHELFDAFYTIVSSAQTDIIAETDTGGEKAYSAMAVSMKAE